MTIRTNGISTLKQIPITYPSPRENSFTPVDLATSEPGTPQTQYTVLSGDMPSYSSHTPASAIYVANLIAGGQNTNAGDQTIYWAMYKNSASVSTGSFTVTASLYWTISSFFYDCDVGDVLEVATWASSTDVNISTDAIALFPTRLKPELNKTMIELELTLDHHPQFATGVAATSGIRMLLNDYYLTYQVGDSMSIPAHNISQVSYADMYRSNYGDYNSSNSSQTKGSVTAVSFPNYYAMRLPTLITYRIVLE